MSHDVHSYFLGGTWPTLTRTQMTFRVCIPTEQEASLPRLWATDMLPVEMDVSSVHCPHAPVCQWYTVQGCSLQFLTSCRALMLGHWIPPETTQQEIIFYCVGIKSSHMKREKRKMGEEESWGWSLWTQSIMSHNH